MVIHPKPKGAEETNQRKTGIGILPSYGRKKQEKCTKKKSESATRGEKTPQGPCLLAQGETERKKVRKKDISDKMGDPTTLKGVKRKQRRTKSYFGKSRKNNTPLGKGFRSLEIVHYGERNSNLPP